jgi:hypothetical protein
MNNPKWTVTGILSDLIEDKMRAEIHVTLDDGVIVLFLRLNNSEIANSVIQNARNLIGQRISASGESQPHSESKFRSPYFLSPSEISAG